MSSLLRLDHVSKSFVASDGKETTNAVDDISLQFRDGEFATLVGRSGCGKSTILRMIAGLIRPTTGGLYLNDKEITDANPNRGMVFQKPTLFPWLTVEKNVDFSLRMQKKTDGSKDKVDRLLKMVGLDEFRHNYPHHLSGGMAQRVALIRTMINEPEVFLLDEPLGALDAFTRMNIQDELLNMWRKNNHMMIMVTHDIDEAIYLGTRVIVMAPRPGRVVEDIPIDLEYPRNRTSEQFVAYRNRIMELLDVGNTMA